MTQPARAGAFRISREALQPENNNLTLVRLVLASAVILTHCYLKQTGLSEVDWFSSFLGAPVSRFAVDGFFFLSGFLVFRSLHRQGSTKRFVLARLSRLYPALLASVVGTVLVGAAFTSSSLSAYLFGPDTVRFVLGNLSFVKAHYTLTGVYCELGGATGICIVNASIWTLQWEVRCYIALALLGWLGLTSEKPMAYFVMPLTIAFTAAWQVPEVQEAVQAHAPKAVFWIDRVARLWPLFAGGCAAALWRDRIWLHGGVVALLFAGNLIAVDTAFAYTARSLLIAYGILYFGFRQSNWTPFIARLPDYSYGIYIYAYPIAVLLAAGLPDIGPGTLALLNLLAVVPVAALSWHFVEKPVLDAFRRRSMAERAAERHAPAPASAGSSSMGTIVEDCRAG